MARSLVFTNSNSESITFERSPYLITNIEGLGIPSVEVQEQRSPFIDGTTEIDNVIEARDIVMTVSIIAPNDFTNIDTYRRDIIKKLNPKLNAGTIIYTTEGGDSYRIVGTPTSVVFRGKVYGEPFQEVQIIFHCHDPYWTAVNSTTVDIDKLFSGTAQEIAAYAENPTILQKNDGTYILVYYSNGPDAIPPDPDPLRGLAYRTSADGTTWSSEQFVLEENIKNASIVQFSDDTFLIVYRAGDNKPYALYSSNGTSWTTISQVVNTEIGIPHIEVDAADIVYFVYNRLSDGYILKQTSSNKGNTWSSASTIVSSNSLYPRIHQRTDGTFGLIYTNQSDGYLKYRTSSDTVTWSNAISVANEDSSIPVIIQRFSGEIIVLYNFNSASVKMRSSFDNGATWGSASVVVASGNANDIILQQDGVLRLVYVAFNGPAKTTYQLLGEENTVTHASDVDVPCQIIFNGPAVNPRIDNMAKAEFIRIIKTLAASDYFVVDTGLKTVQIYISGIPANGTAFLDLQSTFFTIDPGTTSLAFSDETPSGTTATATVTYRERYAGI